MAISRDGALTPVDQAGSTALTMDISAVPTGSFIVIQLMSGNTTVGVTLPVGWTVLAAYVSPGNPIGSRQGWVLAKIKAPGDTFVVTKAASLVLRAQGGYGSGSDPVADWQVGTLGRRQAGQGTTTTSVAPSITTGEANTLPLAFLFEATSAEVSVTQALSGSGWTQWMKVDDVVAPDTTLIEQMMIAYKTPAAAGATGDATVTYSPGETQANNGAGVQIAITPSGSNVNPVAAFTHVETVPLHVAVNGTTSSDSDGTIASYDWDWGDGTSHGSGSTATHDYAAADTYTVVLTVTDNLGGTNAVSHDVTVETAGGGPGDPLKMMIGDDIAEARSGANRVSAIWAGAVLLRRWGYTVSDMLVEDEIQVAWRGLGNVRGEETMAAYDHAVAQGFKCLEVSVNYSSDGVPVMIHDDTVDRVTPSTGTVVGKTWATLDALAVDTPTSGDTLGRLETLLDAYAETHVIFIDDKTNSHTAAMLSLLAGYPNPTEHFVYKGFRGWTPAADLWAAAGYERWGIYYDIDSGVMGTVGSPHSSVSHFSLLGLNWDAAQTPHWDNAVAIAAAQGKRLLAHVIHSTGNATTARSKGADGLMTGVTL